LTFFVAERKDDEQGTFTSSATAQLMHFATLEKAKVNAKYTMCAFHTSYRSTAPACIQKSSLSSSSPPTASANERERGRTQSVNGAFHHLRQLIPTEPVDRKLSKIEVLRLATSYIEHLATTLDCGE
jgi:hypothetical protein